MQTAGAGNQTFDSMMCGCSTFTLVKHILMSDFIGFIQCRAYDKNNNKFILYSTFQVLKDALQA